MLEVFDLVPAMPIVGNHVFMILEQTAPVRHSEQRYLQLLGLHVQFGLNIHAHRACALIQDGENRLMVKQSSHCHSLLLPTRQHIVPVIV